jgi:hypothetical protein
LEKESVISLTGGTGTGKITLCLGPDFKIGELKGCGEIPLSVVLQKSSLPGCSWELIFRYDYIKVTLNASLGGFEDEITVIDAPGKKTEPKCIIKE